MRWQFAAAALEVAQRAPHVRMFDSAREEPAGLHHLVARVVDRRRGVVNRTYEGKLVRFEGGEVPGPYGGLVHPVLDTLALWVDWNGCTGSLQTSNLPDADPDDGTTVIVSEYEDCTDNTSIRLYLIEGGGHTWPGAGEYNSSASAGNTSHDFSATEVIWEFFEQHPQP